MIGRAFLNLTFYISLIVQFITGIVTLGGVFYKLPKQDKILLDILALETVVQLVEGFFYVYIIMSLRHLRNNAVTQRRYLDWIVTTPMMLLSTIMYMEYENKKQYDKIVNTKEFIFDNKKNITNMFLFNILMLISGFLGETRMVNKYVTIPIGFIFMFLSFNIIYQNYVGNVDINKKIFMFLTIVWGLYGVAALCPVIIKNISYNMLDIISKNFYGLFLFFKVKELSSINKY
jgi:bacteriorhodopsin